jgi:hypothetical protein
MWKRFFLPMALVLVAIMAITLRFRCIYGNVFWENFLAQFLATVIGVIFSILLAWAFWRWQQSDKRNQLKKDLIAEASVNSERVHALDQLIKNVLQKRPSELTWDDPLIKSMLDNRYRLRTAAMKNISAPEHLVLISKLDLADYLEWLLPESKLYNQVLSQGLDRFWLAGYKRKDVLASMIDLNEVMFPSIFRLLPAFDIIIAKEKDLLGDRASVS